MVVLCARWPKSIRPPIGRAWSKQVPPHAAKAQWQPKRAPQTMALSLARPNMLFCSGGRAWRHPPLPNWPRAPFLCCKVLRTSSSLPRQWSLESVVVWQGVEGKSLLFFLRPDPDFGTISFLSCYRCSAKPKPSMESCILLPLQLYRTFSFTFKLPLWS